MSQGASREHPQGALWDQEVGPRSGPDNQGGSQMLERWVTLHGGDRLICNTEPSGTAARKIRSNTRHAQKPRVPRSLPLGLSFNASDGVERETDGPPPAPFLFSINAQLEGGQRPEFHQKEGLASCLELPRTV